MGLIRLTETACISLARAVSSRRMEALRGLIWRPPSVESKASILDEGTMTSTYTVHIHRRDNLFRPYPPSETLQSADMRNPSPIVGRREHMTNRGSTVRLEIARPLVPVGAASFIAAAAIGLSGASPGGGQPNTTRSTSAQTFEWDLENRALSTTAFVNRALRTSVG